MRVKVVIGLVCLMTMSCATTGTLLKAQENEMKYAVAYCLSQSYPNSEFSNDAEYVAGAYLQKGSFGIDMYEKIREYVSQYRSEKYVSKHDRNLNVMQCIDLYDSRELSSLIHDITNKED